MAELKKIYKLKLDKILKILKILKIRYSTFIFISEGKKIAKA